MIETITASDAEKMTKEALRSSPTPSLAEVMRDVRNSAKMGNDCIIVHNGPSPDVKKALRGLGFHVNDDSIYQGGSFIAWGEQWSVTQKP